MRSFILQEQADDCGLACLKMLLSSVHHSQKYLYLKEEHIGAYSIFDLKEIGLKYGLFLKGVQVDNINELTSSICLLDIDGFKHYILVKKITKSEIIYFDPAKGKIKIKKNDFINLFTGYALIIDKVEEHKLNKKTYILSFWYFFAYIMSLFIDFGFVYLLSYFVKDENYKMLPLISILGIVFNFMFKILISLLASKSIEKKYLLKRIDEFNEDQIKKIIIFKKDYLHFYFSLINYSCIFIFGIIFLLINGFYSIFFIGFTLICLALRFTVINKILKEKNDYGEKLEKELFNSSKKKEIYQKGVKNAENYSLYYYVVPLVYIVIIALALALTNQIFNYYSLNYYLFYIGFYFTLYECGNNFLKIITSELEKIKAQKSYVQNL